MLLRRITEGRFQIQLEWIFPELVKEQARSLVTQVFTGPNPIKLMNFAFRFCRSTDSFFARLCASIVRNNDGR